MSFAVLITMIFTSAIIIFAASFLIVEIYVVIVGHLKGAPYVRSKKDKIKTMLELADIKPGEVVVDLGSGDGSILIEAAKRGAIAMGIEINPFLVWHSRRHVRRAGLEDKIKILKSDFRSRHLGNADVIFLYLWPSTIEELQEKFSRELKPGTRIVSNGFPLLRLEPHALKNGVFIYHYRGETSIVGG